MSVIKRKFNLQFCFQSTPIKYKQNIAKPEFVKLKNHHIF